MTSARFLAALMLGMAVCEPSAAAQPYPSKSIRMIAPYTPGSPVDALACLVVPQVSARLGQSIVMDNRPGAGTTIGTKAARPPIRMDIPC
jgi:tripartite-type tricarboxylate transporter receptor subunit TctC